MGKNVLTLTITILLAACLAACGGSTTGTTDSSAAKDTITPEVSYTTPANHATGVTVNSSVAVTFSEQINPATLNEQTFTISEIDPVTLITINVIQVVVTYDPGSRTATFSHQGLTSNSAYTATITRGLKDLAGNALANEYTWTFTTSFTTDTGAPWVKIWVPGPANVPVNSAITAVFSEPMDFPSINNAFTLREETTSVPVTGSIEYIGGTATFKPSVDLKANTTYTAGIDTSASDLAGNQLDANNSSWTFTTSNDRDDTLPKIILGSVIPADEATDVSETSLFSIAFNEPIYPFLYGTVDGVPGTISFDYENNNRVTLTPSQNLKQGSKYNVSIQVKDLAGNIMPIPFTWSFTVRTPP